MRTALHGPPRGLLGIRFPSLWRRGTPSSRFGDVAVLLFLVTQYLDGMLTYVGVLTYGIGSEGNPILATMMETVGHGTALLMAKAVAVAFGIVLHLAQIHTVVALLAAFYLTVAVVPWATILFVAP